MKQKSLLTLLLLVALGKGFGQTASKLLKDVNEIEVRNIGAIFNKNQVKGYFTFYVYDKADKKNTVYKLHLVDENLNDLGTTEILDAKDVELQGSAFDGTNFCFKFWNDGNKTYETRVYNQEGKEVINDFLPLGKNGRMGTNYEFNLQANKEVNTLNGNGFIVYNYNGENSSFHISYVNGSTKKMWNTVYETDRKYKGMVPTHFLGANQSIVLTAVLSIDKGMYTATSHDYIIANDITDGKLLFDVATDFDDDHIVPISAFFQGEDIIVVGLKYASAKAMNKAPEGLAFIKLDKTGKILSKKIGSFESDLTKYIAMEDNKSKDGYSLFIHDIIRTYNNTNLVVAEKYKGASASGLELENLAAIEYDDSFKVINVKEIPKEPYRLYREGSLPFASAYSIATQAKLKGDMEYLYYQKNDEKKEITLSYVEFSGMVDYSDINKRRIPKNFVQTKVKNGVYTTDKVPVKMDDFKKSEFTRILPAKTGFVLEVNYFKKEKELSFDFIKLNN